MNYWRSHTFGRKTRLKKARVEARRQKQWTRWVKDYLAYKGYPPTRQQ